MWGCQGGLTYVHRYAMLCMKDTEGCALCAGVDVPVKEVCGRSIAQGAVGDELHVGVAGLDGKVEGNVVAYVGRVSTVLVSTRGSHASASHDSLFQSWPDMQVLQIRLPRC